MAEERKQEAEERKRATDREGVEAALESMGGASDDPQEAELTALIRSGQAKPADLWRYRVQKKTRQEAETKRDALRTKAEEATRLQTGLKSGKLAVSTAHPDEGPSEYAGDLARREKAFAEDARRRALGTTNPIEALAILQGTEGAGTPSEISRLTGTIRSGEARQATATAKYRSDYASWIERGAPPSVAELHAQAGRTAPAPTRPPQSTGEWLQKKLLEAKVRRLDEAIDYNDPSEVQRLTAEVRRDAAALQAAQGTATGQGAAPRLSEAAVQRFLSAQPERQAALIQQMRDEGAGKRATMLAARMEEQRAGYASDFKRAFAPEVQE